MTHVYKNNSGRNVIACKGAPEGIIKKSTLSAAGQTKVLSKVEVMASQGYRVLDGAKASDESREWPADQDQFT